VSGPFGESLHEVADKVAETGFEVEDVLTTIGCVIGLAEPAVAERIRSIPGVSDVSEVLVHDIGPPEGDQPV
jgi:hypothetical protein